MPNIFDGRAYAKNLENELKLKVDQLKVQGKIPRVKTFVFTEDRASVLYTRLKTEAAKRIGIVYESIPCSLGDDPESLVRQITQASSDPLVSGVMIQKPTKEIFNEFSMSQLPDFGTWWEKLVSAIDPKKDLDGLVQTSGVMPATVRAVLAIMGVAKVTPDMSVVILGRSRIVGQPLYEKLIKIHKVCDLFGQDNYPQSLAAYDVVISAVGKPRLVKGEMVKDGAVIVDVGSPIGDVDYESVLSKARFITPVPGGVGPVTVACLMQSACNLD